MLPRSVLNRFYAADSVKTSAHSTWLDCLKDTGKDLLAKTSSAAISYYIESSSSPNHMVCEAALYALSEHASKINKEFVLPYVHQIVETLSRYLDDNRWPVRDVSCIAIGIVIHHFPNNCKHKLEYFIQAIKGNLKDPIWSVRSNAADAFAEILASDDSDIVNAAFETSMTYLGENLMYIRVSQSSKATKSFLPDSLFVPLQKKGKELSIKSSGWSCCIDCESNRNALPWEVSHGAVLLLSQLLIALVNSKSIYRSKGETSFRQLAPRICELWSLLDTKVVELNGQKSQNEERLQATIYNEVSYSLKSIFQLKLNIWISLSPYQRWCLLLVALYSLKLKYLNDKMMQHLMKW